MRRGGERYLADLSWYLDAAGHQVEVLTGTEATPGVTMQGLVTERRIRHRTPARLVRRGLTHDETFGLLVLPTLLRRRWDVAHAFTPSAALAAVAAGLPTVYTVLGHPEPSVVAKHPHLARLFGLAVRRATVTVALSRASALATSEVFGGRAEVLPPGVRLDQFPPALGPRVGPPRILFSAHAGDRRKRVQDALLALGLLLDRRPDARLELSGAGDHGWAVPMLGSAGDRILAATDALGVGALSDLPGRYRSASATVLPAEGEAFGLAVVESLAAGTPVVVANAGGPPELVDSPLVGRVAPLGDAAALATALDEVITLAADPETPARCVSSARRWDWAARVGPMHEELYESIRRR